MQQVQKAATELEKAATAAVPPPASGVQRVQVQTPPFNIGDYVMWDRSDRRGLSASWC
jgi:hypothetical protein